MPVSSDSFDSPTFGSIEHQAEKLGYLVATVEYLFQQRAKDKKHKNLATHSSLGAVLLKKYLDGEISLIDYSEQAALLLDKTTRLNDEVNANLQNSTNQLNKMVVDSLEAGKLRFFVEKIEGGE